MHEVRSAAPDSPAGQLRRSARRPANGIAPPVFLGSAAEEPVPVVVATEPARRGPLFLAAPETKSA